MTAVEQKILATQANYQKPMHRIKTHLLTEDNKEYKVLIRLPRLEYMIESDNFCFIKTLSLAEFKEFQLSLFADWQDLAIKHLNTNGKFQMMLLDIRQRINNGLNLKTKKKVERQEKDLQPMDL